MTDVALAPRLDMWLAADREITRHAAHMLIDAGLVTVNGRPGRPGQRIRDRDLVEVIGAGAGEGEARPGRPRGRNPAGVPPLTLPSTSAPSRSVSGPRRSPGPPLTLPGSAPSARSLVIVYEDEWLAVVDKPAGMVVHRAPGHANGTLADALVQRGTTWSLLGGAERPGIVHRLDRDTSGLLVVAKTEAAHRALAAQLRARTLGRTYWALVRGGFRERTGTIDAPIGRDRGDRKRMAVSGDGRDAITDFVVMEALRGMSVLEVTLRTGRTHQIRVHLAHIGHPVIGDAVYGRAEPGLGRMALHAMRLRFDHPVDGQARTFESAVPPELIGFHDAHL